MKKNRILLILLLLFSLSCTRGIKKDTAVLKGQVNGRVVYQGRGLDGALIYAYRKDDKTFLLSLSAVSVPSDKNGNFSLELDTGIYFLMARKADNPDVDISRQGGYFSYFGGNPVRVSKGEKVEFILNCVSIKKALIPEEILPPAGMDKPGISGIVYHGDKPLQDAEVFFYLNMESDLRGPAYFSVFTDGRGRFFAPVEPGTYFIVCRKRMGTEQFGPIREGDYFGFYESNPVNLKQGENEKAIIYVLKKDAPKGASVVVTPSGLTNANQTSVSGKVYDLMKKPVRGVYVCLYKTEEMVGKPEYISNKTGEDGFFEINLASGGKFYLIAKENFGAIPEPNDFIGYLGNSKDHSIEIAVNKNTGGLEIIGEKILSK